MSLETGILRILVVEDYTPDFELIRLELRRCKADIEIQRADSLATTAQCLLAGPWHLVISDFNLPDCNAFDILDLVRKQTDDIPVVLVSGAVGEENAIEIMRSGASDFIIKQNLTRLAPAVERELREAQSRRQIQDQRRATETALREREAFCRSIIETAEEGIWILDTEERLTFVNDKLCQLLGRERPSLLGLHASDLFASDHRASAGQVLRDLRTGGERQQHEWRLSRMDGTHVDTQASAVPILDAHGEFKGSFAMFADITTHKQAEAALATANEAKSRFLANMSHEIRTPLSIILGFSELALDQRSSPTERRNALVRIHRNAQVLSELINDVLDLSKVEASKLEIESRPFNLREMLQDLIATFELKAQDKKLQILTSLPPDLPDRLKGDPVRLRQILTNLLMNAIKFTDVGHVLLMIDPPAIADGRMRLRISVEDSGIGISPHQRDLLFQPFSQINTSMNRKHGGTGLGLSLSKHLAESMGGSLQLEFSDPGKGSCFVLEVALNLEKPSLPEQTVKQPGRFYETRGDDESRHVESGPI